MAFLGQTYKTEDLPQSEDFTPVPPGWYAAQVTEADLRDTRSGTGQYIWLRWDILGPEYAGRVVFNNINIRNQSSKAEEIGNRQLGDLLKAVGLHSISDTDELVGKSCDINVRIRKSEEYGDQNEIKSFRSSGGSVPAPAKSETKTETKSASKEPWER